MVECYGLLPKVEHVHVLLILLVDQVTREGEQVWGLLLSTCWFCMDLEVVKEWLREFVVWIPICLSMRLSLIFMLNWEVGRR